MAKPKIYHWSAAFRVQHWVHLAAIIALVITGFYIHRPYIAGAEETMAWMRWVHLVAAYFLMFALVWRVYLMFNSQSAADWREILPLWRNLKHIPDIASYYLFMKNTHRHYHRYNPLQALAYTLMGLTVICMVFTGFALHTGWLHAEFAWVNPLLGGLMYTRIVHYFGMWLLIVLSLVHLYFVIRQDALDGDRTLLSMIDGYCLREANE
ncbi:MAG: Ni/Fe-hydrogenase, b-type cytochrome subunit [Nitrospirota bacterium]